MFASAQDYPIYLCPLCISSFFLQRENIIHQSSEFTLDHFPPASVGGWDTVFVCKECNSNSGAEYDYAIKEYIRFIDFLSMKADSEYTGKVRYDGTSGNYNTGLKWSKNGQLIQNLGVKRDSLVVRSILEMAKPDKGWSFKVRMEAPSSDKLEKAILRAAYLFCFSRFGYGFALSYTGGRLRDILKNEFSHPLENHGVHFDNTGESFGDGMYVIEEPSHARSFVIVFSFLLPGRDLKKASVIIPGPDEKDWVNFPSFGSTIGDNQLDVTATKLDLDFIKRCEYFKYQGIWAHFSN